MTAREPATGSCTGPAGYDGGSRGAVAEAHTVWVGPLQREPAENGGRGEGGMQWKGGERKVGGTEVYFLQYHFKYFKL